MYFLLFLHNTASFYVAEEYNERVVGRYLDRSSEVVSDISDRTSNPFGIDDFNQNIKPLNDSIAHVSNAIDSLKALKSEQEVNRELLQAKLEQSRTEEIDILRHRQLFNIRDSIDTFENLIADSLKNGIPED